MLVVSKHCSRELYQEKSESKMKGSTWREGNTKLLIRGIPDHHLFLPKNMTQIKCLQQQLLHFQRHLEILIWFKFRIYPCLLCQSAMAQAISAEGEKINLRTNGLSRHQMKRKSSLKWIRIYRRRVWRTQDWNIRCDTGQADTPLLQMALKQLRLQHWARGKTKSTTALSMTEA